MLMVVTLEVIGQLLRSSKVGSSGQLYFAMLTVFIVFVSIVNIWVPYPIVI